MPPRPIEWASWSGGDLFARMGSRMSPYQDRPPFGNQSRNSLSRLDLIIQDITRFGSLFDMYFVGRSPTPSITRKYLQFLLRFPRFRRDSCVRRYGTSPSPTRWKWAITPPG